MYTSVRGVARILEKGVLIEVVQECFARARLLAVQRKFLEPEAMTLNNDVIMNLST